MNKKAGLPLLMVAGALFLGLGAWWGYKAYTTQPNLGELPKTTKEQKVEFTAYYLDDKGELTSKPSRLEPDVEKGLNAYILNFLKGKEASLSVYEDEEGRHLRISISDLNFLDYYVQHPAISEVYPAYALAGDTTDRLPMVIQHRLAEAIDRTAKESYGIAHVHWTIAGRLEPNDGILFGEVPKKSAQILEGVPQGESYFVEPDGLSNAATNKTPEETYNETMARLRLEYPDGDIPPEKLPEPPQ